MPSAHMAAVTVIPSLIYPGLACSSLLPEDRCVRTPEDRAKLPKGTITIGSDDCHAVADGNGGFHDVGLAGPFPAEESVILPAYIIAGPGLPILLPGSGGAILSSQHHVHGIRYEFYAVDTAGKLFRWTALDDLHERFAWETAGQVGEASPAFPITAWQ